MLNKYDLLLEYFYKERTRLENDIKQLQDNIRFRRVSTIDCLELIIAQERLAAFMDFSNNVRALLRLRYASELKEDQADEETEEE